MPGGLLFFWQDAQGEGVEGRRSPRFFSVTEGEKMKLVMCASVGPENGACWMQALGWYAGEAWGDRPECVCPTIRTPAFSLNDYCPTPEDREATIGPHLFKPLGTTTSLANASRRALAESGAYSPPSQGDIDTILERVAIALRFAKKFECDGLFPDDLSLTRDACTIADECDFLNRAVQITSAVANIGLQNGEREHVFDMILQMCEVGEHIEITKAQSLSGIYGWPDMEPTDEHKTT